MIDKNYAPEGMIATATVPNAVDSCTGCVYLVATAPLGCSLIAPVSCCAGGRPDDTNVIFIRKETSNADKL